ncbi:MAG: AMP-binding protein [Paracoccaceae bacterium]
MQDHFRPLPNDLPPELSLMALAGVVGADDRQVDFIRPGGTLRMTHAGLLAGSARVAGFLLGLGLSRGDRVGICMANGPEWAMLDLACLRLGLVVAGFDPVKFTPDAGLKARYRLGVLFADQPGADVIGREVLANLPDSPIATLPAWPDYHPADEVALKFTSGSTGEAKALAATFGSIGSSLAAVQQMFGHGRDDRLFVFLTLSLLQQRYWLYTALLHGCDLVIATPQTALFALRETRPTVIMGVPAFFETVKSFIEAEVELNAAAVAEAAQTVTGGRVRYMWTGSAPIRPTLLEWFDETAALPLFEGYGMNETCIVTKNHPGAHRRGSAGRPVEGKQVWIGEDGVIRVRSRCPVNTVYAHAQPGASEQVFHGDTVYTGDLGHIDADGFLWITGRADDVIVLENGRNIATRALEERALTCAGIMQCVIAGSGKPWLVALVCAGPDADLDAVRVAINRNAGPDTAVRHVLRMTVTPTEANGLLTSQGKPVRKAILARHQDEIEATYRELANV